MTLLLHRIVIHWDREKVREQLQLLIFLRFGNMLPHVICHHARVSISFNCLPDKHALYLEHFVPEQNQLMWFWWRRRQSPCRIWCHTCIPFAFIFAIHVRKNQLFKSFGHKMKTSFHKAEELEKSEHLILLQEGLASDEKPSVWFCDPSAGGQISLQKSLPFASLFTV